MTEPSVLYKLEVSGNCPNVTASEISIGKHTLLIDEPGGRGGTDTGATPLEVLLSSLVGCTNVISNRIAKEMKIDLEIRTIRVVGSLDMNVLSGKTVDAVFPQIHLNVEFKSDSDEQSIENLKAQLAQRCPISVLLRHSGSQVIEQWSNISD